MESGSSATIIPATEASAAIDIAAPSARQAGENSQAIGSRFTLPGTSIVEARIDAQRQREENTLGITPGVSTTLNDAAKHLKLADIGTPVSTDTFTTGTISSPPVDPAMLAKRARIEKLLSLASPFHNITVGSEGYGRANLAPLREVLALLKSGDLNAQDIRRLFAKLVSESAVNPEELPKALALSGPDAKQGLRDLVKKTLEDRLQTPPPILLSIKLGGTYSAKTYPGLSAIGVEILSQMTGRPQQKLSASLAEEAKREVAKFYSSPEWLTLAEQLKRDDDEANRKLSSFNPLERVKPKGAQDGNSKDRETRVQGLERDIEIAVQNSGKEISTARVLASMGSPFIGPLEVVNMVDIERAEGNDIYSIEPLT